MQKSIVYKEVEVVYNDRGQGACILLLHGYLETGGVWESFAERFPDQFRVITMICQVTENRVPGEWYIQWKTWRDRLSQ